MNKKDQEKRELKKKAISDALLQTVNGGLTPIGGALPKPGPVNFHCTFDPNPNYIPFK